MRGRGVRAIGCAALAVAFASSGSACESGGSPHAQACGTPIAIATSTVVPPPAPIGIGTMAVTGMTPRTGPPGTRAVITGDQLTSVRTVCFGTRAATGLSYSNGGLKLTVTVPAGSGTVEVTVIVKSGRSARLTTFRYRDSAVGGALASAGPSVLPVAALAKPSP
jgi:hypothetical protein